MNFFSICENSIYPFQGLSLNYTESSSKNKSTTSKNNKKNSKKSSSTKDLDKIAGCIGEKDTSLFLFRALGKILYCKRMYSVFLSQFLFLIIGKSMQRPSTRLAVHYWEDIQPLHRDNNYASVLSILCYNLFYYFILFLFWDVFLGSLINRYIFDKIPASFLSFFLKFLCLYI